jgi:predicted TIM-barrel fold metal-dependent hydrolase
MIKFHSSGQKHLMPLAVLALLLGCTNTKSAGPEKQSAAAYYTLDDFYAVKKIDTHVHLNTDDTAYINQAEKDNVRFLDIVDDRPFGLPMDQQEQIAIRQVKAFPKRLAYATTFSVKGWDQPDWPRKTLAKLQQSFANGAIAVKVWKNIGMDLRDEKGKFVMVDDPRLDFLFDYLEQNNIPVIGHNGEPKECWMPLEQMVLNRGYYSQHPEYHMYLHPEYPTYEDQIRARDNLLEKHPRLKFIGAHLASLEWSLEELAKRLDKYPNLAVDLARMSNLHLHAKTDWQKTHDFFIKYQDRLVYATDVQVGATQDPAAMKKNAHESRIRNWKFFATDEKMVDPRDNQEFRGLKLPRQVIDKIYRTNAERWLTPMSKMDN